MHQQGQTPVLRYGIEISMVQDPVDSSEARSNNNDKRNSNRSSNIINSTTSPLSPPSTSSNGKTVQPSMSAPKFNDDDKVVILPYSPSHNNNYLLEISNRAWANYKRSSMKLLLTMDKVWKQSTTNFPDRFSKSVKHLSHYC